MYKIVCWRPLGVLAPPSRGNPGSATASGGFRGSNELYRPFLSYKSESRKYSCRFLVSGISGSTTDNQIRNIESYGNYYLWIDLWVCLYVCVSVVCLHVCMSAGADPRRPWSSPGPKFWGPKLEHLRPYLYFSSQMSCFALLKILFLEYFSIFHNYTHQKYFPASFWLVYSSYNLDCMKMKKKQWTEGGVRPLCPRNLSMLSLLNLIFFHEHKPFGTNLHSTYSQTNKNYIFS